MQGLTEMNGLKRASHIDLNQEQLSGRKNLQLLPVPYFNSSHVTLYKGDAEMILSGVEAESIDCIVTSPPYYGKRDYGITGQLGLEEHPQLYIDRLVAVFHQARRVLKPTGSLWVNIGDTYWSGKGRSHGIDVKQRNRRFDRPQDKRGQGPWCVPKQLLLIPHRFAIAMQDDGWIVRNDNVWYKPAPMPDPVSDRCALAHEYIFHFVKQRKYYFDAEAVAMPSNGKRDRKPPFSVWSVPTSSGQTMPARKKHIATFPEQLVSLPVQATCPPNGVLLDPFCGSGTALLFAVKQSKERHAIGIDISEDALQEAKDSILLFEQDLLQQKGNDQVDSKCSLLSRSQ
jgi:site-specific DNA-methyltransferase (cytosine-N4-specific)